MTLSEEDRRALIGLANEARKLAYAPYSKYRVGAALRTGSGKTYTGVNVENASYPLSICAERAAIVKAVSDGERMFEAMVVVTDNGASPCGGCRQVMAEFGLKTIVLIVNGSSGSVRTTTVGELLPDAFQPRDLDRS
jgi:cytidine deaminase